MAFPVLGQVLGLLLVFGMNYWYTRNIQDLSAKYSAEERLQKNLAMTAEVNLHHPSADPNVAIVESAYPSLFSGNITYTVGIYKADAEEIAKRSEKSTIEEAMQSVYAYSKTPASKDELLHRYGTALIITSKDGTVISYSDQN